MVTGPVTSSKLRSPLNGNPKVILRTPQITTNSMDPRIVLPFSDPFSASRKDLRLSPLQAFRIHGAGAYATVSVKTNARQGSVFEALNFRLWGFAFVKALDQKMPSGFQEFQWKYVLCTRL